MPTGKEWVVYGLSAASALCLVVAAFLKGGLVPGIEAAGYALGAMATLWGSVNVASVIAATLPRKS